MTQPPPAFRTVVITASISLDQVKISLSTNEPGSKGRLPHSIVSGLGPTDPSGVPIAAVTGGLFAGIPLTIITAFGIWVYTVRNNVLPPTTENTWTKPELSDIYRPEIDDVAQDPPELKARDHWKLEARPKAVELGMKCWGIWGAREMEGLVPGELEGTLNMRSQSD
ncbi:MAG: hypothetical protein Q9166_003099 [cf. Caloplaca sp. 2 TL-2023]